MAENPFQFVKDLFASPVYGLLDTAANIGIPGAAEAQDWSVFDSTPGFRLDHPGWATAADIASFLVPGAGWARATQGGNALMRAGAALGGNNSTLRFIGGEAARWAPFNAAITGFDAWGGRYDSAAQTGAAFLGDQVLGMGLSALGASPTVQRLIEAIPGVGGPSAAVFRSAFGPTPELRALYQLGEDLPDQIGLRNLASQYNDDTPWQRIGRDLIDRRNEVVAGANNNYTLQDVDTAMARARSESLNETPYVNPDSAHASQRYTQFPTPTDPATRQRVETFFRQGQRLSQDNKLQRRYTQNIANDLDLPEHWEFMGRYYRLNEFRDKKGADYYRRNMGLMPSNYDTGFRRVDRYIPRPGQRSVWQTWAIRQENDGMWIAATELPRKDPKDPARFIQFKTDQPDFFFPENQWMKDIDRPDDFRPERERVGTKAWDPIDALPGTVNPLFDAYRKTVNEVVNEPNMTALRQSAAARGGGVTELAQRLGVRDKDTGLNLAGFVERYITPTMFKYGNDPRAASVLQGWRLAFDVTETFKHELMYGAQGLDPNRSILGTLVRGVGTPPNDGVAQAIRKATSVDSKAVLEDFRRGWRSGMAVDDWADGPAKDMAREIEALNKGWVKTENEIRQALGRPKLKELEGHMGLSRSFGALGNTYVAIRDGDNNLVGLGVGNGITAAQRRAQAVIDMLRKEGNTGQLDASKAFTLDRADGVPADVRRAVLESGYARARAGVRGFKWDVEEIASVDDLVQAMDRSYGQRSRYLAEIMADAFTAKDYARVLKYHPEVGANLSEDLNALRGKDGPFSDLQNKIVDTLFAPMFGPGSATKIANGLNKAMHHLSFGMGNLSYPIVNATTVIQTAMPEYVAAVTANPTQAAKMGYVFPLPDGNGNPSGGFTAVADAIGASARAWKMLSNPSPLHRSVMEALQKDGELSPRFAEEYMGQNASRARATFEGLDTPEKVGEKLEALSNWLPATSEKLTRGMSAAMAIDMMEKLAALRGVRLTEGQLVHNVKNFVRRTNYAYAASDRPAMFRTPAGMMFGGMKNWFMHYLYNLFQYTGMARDGNWAPIMLSLGGLGALGGVAALPVAGVLDWASETFADKPLMNQLYGALEEPYADTIAFGLPGLMGLSLSGQVAAPGARFGQDLSFLGSFVAYERMKNMARAVGRHGEQAALGVDPWSDPVFRQQVLQGWAPRSIYRAYDTLADDALTSAATGYPLVDGLTPAQRIMQGLGFTATDTEREYAVYDAVRKSSETRRAQTALLGEQYYLASVGGRAEDMERIILIGAMRGVSHDSIIRSAAGRARDAGTDMWGRLARTDRENAVAEYGAALQLPPGP